MGKLIAFFAAGAVLFCLGLEAGSSLSGESTCVSSPLPPAVSSGCTAQEPDSGRTVPIPCRP